MTAIIAQSLLENTGDSIEQNAEAVAALCKVLNINESFIEKMTQTRINYIEFSVEGVIFRADFSPQDHSTQIKVTATLGVLPFTAESKERRKMLQSVVEKSGGLPQGLFTINDNREINLEGNLSAPSPLTLDQAITPIVIFIKQTIPYIRLIGELL